MEMQKSVKDSLIIGNKKIPVKIMEIKESELNFYSKNPRVYNVLNFNNEEPTQNEIEKYMCGLDHVKQLKVTIESNGGLIDPLIVMDKSFVVLEGNSRLAAYRLLASMDPIKWSYVKCKVIPNDVSEEVVFKLLGQYHIIGKKDWDPFEQAHYLYRRKEETKQSMNAIAQELGLPPRKVNQMIKTIEFMKKYNDLNKRNWSYYDEYLKNRAISKYRDTSDTIDEAIAEQIKSHKIAQASDIRNLGKIAALNDNQAKKVMKKIIEGSISLDEGYEVIEKTGKLDDAYKKLKNFHDLIRNDAFVEQLKGIAKEFKVRNENKIGYELNRIITKLKQINRDIDRL